MKTVNYFQILQIAILLTNSLTVAFAGQEGHGGDGLIINGKPYLLDLVEAGVEDKPLYNANIKINPLIMQSLTRSLPQFDSATNKLAKKLSEIHAVSPRIAWALTYSFDFYDFRLVNPSLVNIPDEDSSIDYNPKDLVQLAIRKGPSILINRESWAKLDSHHQAALLLHEMVYALANIEQVDVFVGYDSIGKPIFVSGQGQLSAPARSLVGFFYSEGFVNDSYRSRLESLLSHSSLNQIKNPPMFQIVTAVKLSNGYGFISDFLYNDYENKSILIEKNKPESQIIEYCNSINNLIYFNDYYAVQGAFGLVYNSKTNNLEIGHNTIKVRSLETTNSPETCLASYKYIQANMPTGEPLN